VKRTPFYVLPDDAPAKRKILIAALDLFVQDGLSETSVRDIAAATGFSNPALFKHFPSKAALADYLFERCYLQLFQLIAEAQKSSEKFRARQRAIIEAYMNALDHDPNALLFVQENLRHFWPRMTPEVRQHSILAQVRTLLDQGRSQGKVTREVDLGLLTAAWIGTLQQFARARFFGEFKQPSKEIVAALENLLTKMVKK
jgi:AcrR family transcriptional regulator